MEESGPGHDRTRALTFILDFKDESGGTIPSGRPSFLFESLSVNVLFVNVVPSLSLVEPTPPPSQEAFRRTSFLRGPEPFPPPLSVLSGHGSSFPIPGLRSCTGSPVGHTSGTSGSKLVLRRLPSSPRPFWSSRLRIVYRTWGKGVGRVGTWSGSYCVFQSVCRPTSVSSPSLVSELRGR